MNVTWALMSRGLQQVATVKLDSAYSNHNSHDSKKVTLEVIPEARNRMTEVTEIQGPSTEGAQTSKQL